MEDNGFRPVEVLMATLMQQGPFDGVLGFSEGGMVAQLVCHLAQARRVGKGNKPTKAAKTYCVF